MILENFILIDAWSWEIFTIKKWGLCPYKRFVYQGEAFTSFARILSVNQPFLPEDAGRWRWRWRRSYTGRQSSKGRWGLREWCGNQERTVLEAGGEVVVIAGEARMVRKTSVFNGKHVQKNWEGGIIGVFVPRKWLVFKVAASLLPILIIIC